MPNVKNRRLTINDVVYLWSSTGQDTGIAITVGLEGENGRLTGRRIVSGVPHNVLVLPSLVRRLIDEATAEGWNPHQPIIAPFEHVLHGPFLDAPDRRKQPRPAEHDDEDYIAAIRANPSDDAPRLVYADALLERGDLRGEHMILSVEAFRNPGSRLKRDRMEALVRDHEATWLGPLSYVTRSRLWRRGFLCHAELTRRERGVVAPAVGDPRWWSIEKLDARSAFLADQDIASIIAGAQFDNLDDLYVEAGVLALLAQEGDSWAPHILHVSPGGDLPDQALAQVAAIPKLRGLVLSIPNAEALAEKLCRPGLTVQARR